MIYIYVKNNQAFNAEGAVVIRSNFLNITKAGFFNRKFALEFQLKKPTYENRAFNLQREGPDFL